MEWDTKRWNEVKECCKDCPDKVVGCHKYCTEYNDFRELNMARNKIIREAKHKEAEVLGCFAERAPKMKRSKNDKRYKLGHQ